MQRQLNKLRRYGLIGSGDWRYADVPCGQGRQLVEIYERQVVGDRIGDRVGLPVEVWRLLETGGRGGARAGAGRPEIQTRSVSAASATDKDCAAILTAFESFERSTQVPRRNPLESVTINSNAVTEVSTKEKEIDISSFSFLRKEKKERAERAFPPLGEEPRGSGAVAPEAEAGGAGAPPGGREVAVESTEQVVVDGSLGDGLPVTREEGGDVGLAGRGRQPLMSPEDWSKLPPCPGPAVIAPAGVPGPPLIRAGTSEEDRVRLLLTAYRLVSRRLAPREFNPYDRNRLKAADRKLLLAAAAALCDHEVSPIRWVEFSFDQWRHAQEAAAAEGKAKKGGKQSLRPPLRMLFSTARIAEHAGWCRHERERRGVRVVWTRSLLSLMAKWKAMRLAVLRGEVTAAAAGEKFFPNGSWDRLVERARQDAREMQARIDTEIESGEYLW